MNQPNPQSFSRPKYRPDVDGMRALAILSVLIFHAYPSSLPGGFVGVDIFFVISGYLISSIIFRGLTLGTFSFFDFYARRVRRIFPAVTVVILGSFLLGFFFLTPYELEDLIRESPYAAFFLENWRLYVTTGGYWETATELKPFMHFWSLGVEEQYYIFYPLICFLLWKVSAKRFLASLVLMLLVSLGLCLYDTANEPVRAFYSLHTRFWELLIGGVLAYVELKWPDYKEKIKCQGVGIDNVFSITGLLLIVFAIAFFEEGKDFPGWRALFPTVGSVLIIAAGTNAYLNKYVFSNKVAVFIGLISYPLYLWHWPFICIFRNNLAGELPSGWLMVTLIGLSFLMAYLTYTLIERPMRSKKASWKLVLVLTMILLVASMGSKELVRKVDAVDKLLFAGVPENIQKAREDIPKNDFHTDSCLQKFGHEQYFCKQVGDNPSVLIVGDSHARLLWKHLKHLDEPYDYYFVANDGSLIFQDCYPENRSAYTVDAVNKIWETLEKSPEIKVVGIRGYWEAYFALPIHFSPKSFETREQNLKFYWNQTFRRLAEMHKKVVLVLDNPTVPETVMQRCMPLQRVSLLPAMPECKYSQYDLSQDYLNAKKILLDEAKNWSNVSLLDIEDIFCSSESCKVIEQGRILYKDDDHLSAEGNALTWPLIRDKILSKTKGL